MCDSNFREALAHAAAYCSRAERCKSDVLSAIAKYVLSQEDRTALLSRLEEEGYIDEGRFARAFASDQFRFQHWGRVKIRYALSEKRITDSLIRDALEVIHEEDYEETLRKLLADKLKSTHEADGYKLAAKLMRYACGKGYEPEFVRQCLSTLSDSSLI